MSSSLTLSVTREPVKDSLVFHKVCIGRLSCSSGGLRRARSRGKREQRSLLRECVVVSGQM